MVEDREIRKFFRGNGRRTHYRRAVLGTGLCLQNCDANYDLLQLPLRTVVNGNLQGAVFD